MCARGFLVFVVSFLFFSENRRAKDCLCSHIIEYLLIMPKTSFAAIPCGSARTFYGLQCK